MSAPERIGDIVDLDEIRQRQPEPRETWEPPPAQPRIGPPPCVPPKYATPIDQLEQTPAVTRIRSWLDRNEPGSGLLLSGPVGRGKSTIAGAIALHHAAPYRASYWTVTAMIAAMQREMDQPPEGHPVRVKIDNRPMLVLDDIGTEAATPWQTATIADIIAHRYDNQLGLVATTNLTPRALGERLGERTLSRLHEMCELVVVDGDDRRKGR